MGYTRTAEKKPIARIFVKTDGSGNVTKLSDADCNAVVTSGKIATSGWYQLYTGDGGVSYMKGRETSDIENQQLGVVDVSVDRENSTLRVTLSATGLAELQSLNVFNLGTTGTTGAMGDKESRGSLLGTKGMSFLIYNKNTDPTNETDTPAVTADPFTWIVFNAVPVSEAGMTWNNERDLITLEFRALANTGSGSAEGYKAYFGSFTATA
jgi:hypothetical protein